MPIEKQCIVCGSKTNFSVTQVNPDGSTTLKEPEPQDVNTSVLNGKYICVNCLPKQAPGETQEQFYERYESAILDIMFKHQ